MATIYTNGVPHQSASARFPGITLAAQELGVTRAHLWAVLTGARESKHLMERWECWLKEHPEFASMNPKLPIQPPPPAHEAITELCARWRERAATAEACATTHPHDADYWLQRAAAFRECAAELKVSAGFAQDI